MAGRPRAYQNAEDIEVAAANYMEQNKGKLTITGLALELGFESRQSFYDYEKDGEFSYTIKRLRLQIEAGYEAKLHENSCTGAIFALKNFGWKDSQQIDHTNNGKSFDYSKYSDEDLLKIAELKKKGSEQ